MKKIIFITLSIFLSTQATAEQFSLSPSTTAKRELALRDNVGWQTGCAKPELSSSIKAGNALLNVFLNPDGSTKNVEISSSTGTPMENEEIVKTLSKCKFINKDIGPEAFPKYFYKELKFAWSQGDKHPLVGLKRCMRFSSYPATALLYKQEGTVIIKVRPTSDGGFEKKIIAESVTAILIRHTQQELEKCLDNQIIAQSIRENFKDDNWDEFKYTYQLKK